jgi:hypothetical protein
LTQSPATDRLVFWLQHAAQIAPGPAALPVVPTWKHAVSPALQAVLGIGGSSQLTSSSIVI